MQVIEVRRQKYSSFKNRHKKSERKKIFATPSNDIFPKYRTKNIYIYISVIELKMDVYRYSCMPKTQRSRPYLCNSAKDPLGEFYFHFMLGPPIN